MTEIILCMGSSCYMRGNRENLDWLEETLAEQDSDVELKLVGSRCENRCACGPVVQINGQRHEAVTTEKLQTLLEDFLVTPLADS